MSFRGNDETGSPERYLPREIIAKADLRGGEYAWRVNDIPEVIEAARKAGLINMGGQLQFRFPDGGTCECYWLDVDAFKAVPPSLTWDDLVAQTAGVALAEFSRLVSERDFLEEGRRAFGKFLDEAEMRGENQSEMMWFVWYVLDVEGAGQLGIGPLGELPREG